MIVGELAAGDKDGKRMSLIVDGQKGGTASFTPRRCTQKEISGLVNVEHIATEAIRRGPPSFVTGYVNYGSEDEVRSALALAHRDTLSRTHSRAYAHSPAD
jgi:hypothetical protein